MQSILMSEYCLNYDFNDFMIDYDLLSFKLIPVNLLIL